MIVSIKSNGSQVELPAIKGSDGANGTNGTNGSNGNDGVSPAISVTTITGGHRVSITDATHTETPLTFDVMDGINGTNGTNGADGSNGTNGTTPVKGTDYWTAADQASIVQDVLTALPAAESVSV